MSEIVPSFLLGVFVFISVLLMFQSLRLTEFLLVHGIRWTTLFKIMSYMSISFLPLLLPMSLLFAVLLTYNRLSLDSEIIAFKSSGVNNWSFIAPALVFSLFVGFASSQTSFYLAPWGNRQFEVLSHRVSNTKAAASIKEGTFSEGFFDLVVYSNKVNPQTGLLSDLFIYDEKNPESPLTIIAKEGQIIPDSSLPGHSVLLRLFNGQIHKKSESHTVINFENYDVYLNDNFKLEERKKSLASLNWNELQVFSAQETTSEELRKEYNLEVHKRGAVAATCIVFCVLGLGFGIITNRRSGKSSGFVLSVGFIIFYWVIYLSFESLLRSNQLQNTLWIWTPNLIFLMLGLYNLRKSWN